MDFSWIEIEDTKPIAVKPSVRNLLIIALCLIMIVILTVGSLWLPFNVRFILFVALVSVITFIFIRDFAVVLVGGIILFTIRNYHFSVLDRRIDIFFVFVAVLSLLYVAQLVITRNRIRVYTPLDKFIYAYWAIIVIGILNSILITGNVPLNVLHESSTYLLAPIFLLITVSVIKDKRSIDFVIFAFFLLLLASSLKAIPQSFYIGQYSQEFISRRSAGFFGNANVLAGWLEIFLPVVMAYLLTTKSKREFLVILALAILGYGSLLLTFSRGGFVTGFGSLGLILIFKVRNKAVTAVIIAIFVIGAILASGYIARQLIVFNFEELLGDASVVLRIIQYENYWKMIQKYPVLGIGWGSSLVYHYYGTFERSLNTVMSYGHLNSTFFDFGVHNGVLGIIAVYTLFIAIMCQLWNNAKIIGDKRLSMLNWCLTLSVLSYFTHSFVDGFFKYSNYGAHFWTLVGLGYAARFAWDKYGDKVDEAGRFRFKIVNPFKKYLREKQR